MDFITIISLLLYLGTFFVGFYLDRYPLDSKYKKARKYFIVWLYIFLCFGYMTGSDWRGYEYHYGIPSSLVRSSGEVGFYNMFYLVSLIFKDFWVGVGFLKCLYLYTYIRLLRQFTTNYLSVVSLSMPIFLCFMIIDNPLRYMCALIFVHVAMSLLINKKYLLSICILIASSLLHTTALFFLTMIPCYIYSRKIARTNSYILVALFIITLFISSKIGNISNIVAFFMQYAGMLDLKDYSHYMLRNEDGGNFFSIGSFIQILLFILIVFTKKALNKNMDNGEVIAGIAISYMFLQRFTLMIPTGFRLVIPFGIFYCLYIVMLKQTNRRVFLIFMTIITMQFAKKLYTSYTYIPYSNSIVYIISGHKDYNFRETYNINAFRNRMGYDVPIGE